MSKFIKQGQGFDNEPLLFPSSILNLEVQSIVTVLSQILGLENNRSVNEVILVFLITMGSTKERHVPQFQVVEFLIETMHTQLVNIGTLKHFKYQKYLMHLFFYFNYEHFLELQRHEQ